MNKTTRRILETLFSIPSDAVLIDLDFSHWDKQVSIVVAANIDWSPEGRGFLQRVSFLGVDEFRFHLRHRVDCVSSDEHCRWRVDRVDISEDQGLITVAMTGGPPSPDMVVSCRQIMVLEMDRGDIDVVNPTWQRPSAALAALVRPGLEELASHFRECRRPRG